MAKLEIKQLPNYFPPGWALGRLLVPVVQHDLPPGSVAVRGNCLDTNWFPGPRPPTSPSNTAKLLSVDPGILRCYAVKTLFKLEQVQKTIKWVFSIKCTI